MAHPLVWPGKYFFYAFGNTTAASLSRDLPPEQHADILLLGCGDPRHVLYTVFSEPVDSSRALDFTCCDIDPGVLARNALLLSFIADGVSQDTTWNIFYHLYLDEPSHAALRTQCRKLIDASASTSTWRSSSYGQYLRMSTEHTLAELRRFWSLYDAMHDLPAQRLGKIRDAFNKVFKEQRKSKDVLPRSSTRAAGPAIMKVDATAANQAKNYWKTGTTFADPARVASAKLLNPTFAYSLSGEGCAVHYASDPMAAFHSAASFGNSSRRLRAQDLVTSAQSQFAEWCSAFRASLILPRDNVRVRFCLAEATALCRALSVFGETGALNIGVPIAQFKTQLLRLSSDEYNSRKAPSVFNVIETSNLVDHIGLLNILTAAVPLLSSQPSSVLYTESLLFHGENATKEFADLLYADIGTVGLLLDLCPVDYLSGFSSRSNTHELLLHKGVKDQAMNWQFHQVTTWKRPASCDSNASLHGGHPRLPPVLDTRQLGTLLFDIYRAVFEQEDSSTFQQRNQTNMVKAIVSSNIIHYMREGFVLFLKLVRRRLRISAESWLEVMDRFLDLEGSDATMPMNTVNRNDLYAHLHRQGVHTMDHFKLHKPLQTGRFANWEIVPPVVRIILSVPRSKIATFESVVRASGLGTPLLHCDVRGMISHNIFNAVHVAFGRVISTGTKADPRVLFEEDPEGWAGDLPLVASFCLPTLLLTHIEPPSGLRVCLSVRSTTSTVRLIPQLGFELGIFSAQLADEEHVFIVPEPAASAPADLEGGSGPLLRSTCTLCREIGTQQAVSVELDEQCELIQSLASKITVEDPDVRRSFGEAGAIPQIVQLSPCCMRLSVSGHSQDVVYPFPVVGSQNKLRLARKSLYIEVVVPVAGPFLKPDGMKLNPFPVLGAGGAFHSWNIHRLLVSQLPVLDLRAAEVKHWLNSHIASMLSTRERQLRKKQSPDVLMMVKDTIHSLFVTATGIQGRPAHRVINLRDEKTNNCDTVFFIPDLRYDLSSHTVVCDAYVLPLTRALLRQIDRIFGELVHSGDMVSVSVFEGEMRAWKQLIPAFVERCRTWAHRDDCEYLKQQRVPLTLEMEATPLCSCGKGKDVEGMHKVEQWRKFAPYVTRIAISPLFAVSYLETVGRDPEAHKCSVCRGHGKPKLKACTGCRKARYCSQECQKKDWPRHKTQCKA
ncbi:hypothetical protein BV20DRAFT_956586 [Pilatotrama ljubarskyi]|nr:hypothetical protein BV20DRAFT_956586 [Pilatotrama ljubarskyi]